MTRAPLVRAWPWLLAALAVALPYLPLGARSEYILSVAVFTASTATLALSWDILARTGQLSLAHAAFYGIGAYTYAIAATAGVPTGIAVVLAALVAAVMSLALGAITLRLQGMYFAIATLAFAEVLRTVVNQLAFTGGPQGHLVPALVEGGTRPAYLAALAVLFIAILTSAAITRSRLGAAFTAIRQGEIVARVLGVQATRYKLIAFLISSALVGVVGAMNAARTYYITPPDAFNASISVTALVIPIFGGLYTTAGPVLAAVVLKVAEEGLRLLTPTGYLIGYGAILVLSILFLPRGLMGLLARRRRAPAARAKGSVSRG